MIWSPSTVCHYHRITSLSLQYYINTTFEIRSEALEKYPVLHAACTTTTVFMWCVHKRRPYVLARITILCMCTFYFQQPFAQPIPMRLHLPLSEYVCMMCVIKLKPLLCWMYHQIISKQTTPNADRISTSYINDTLPLARSRLVVVRSFVFHTVFGSFHPIVSFLDYHLKSRTSPTPISMNITVIIEGKNIPATSVGPAFSRSFSLTLSHCNRYACYLSSCSSPRFESLIIRIAQRS